MNKIYGAIGYTILKNNKTGKNIIVFSDMHDKMNQCNKTINIDEWLKNKFKTSKILLEEVPRDGVKLKELWGSSTHTQLLKNLFLKNPDKIVGVDIRPYLIPFSWELIEEGYGNSQEYDITLREYLFGIDNLLSVDNDYLSKNLKSYNINIMFGKKIGYHFIKLKEKFATYVNRYKKYLNYKIKDIIPINKTILNKIDYYLDKLMEWYICVVIYENKKHSIVLHTGLMHSSKVIYLLEILYNYTKTKEYGVNKVSMNVFENSDSLDGCMHLAENDNKLFG